MSEVSALAPPPPAEDPCPVCSSDEVYEATTIPLDFSGRCDVLRVCPDCGWSEKVGVDSVL